MSRKPIACLYQKHDNVISISSDSDVEVEEGEDDDGEEDDEYELHPDSEESVEDEVDEDDDMTGQESSDADDDSEYVISSDSDESESNPEQSPPANPAKSRKITEVCKIRSEKSATTNRREVRLKNLQKKSKRSLIGAMLSREDMHNFSEASKLIGKGELENLKLEHCKAYLRHYLLRLTGPKATLLERVQEHLELRGSNVMDKYPESSFTINCTGDACKGDTVLFTQKVYKKNSYNSTTRSSKQISIGKRVVAGRIIKESYGSDKQQHTFTVEVLWTKGPKALPLLYPLIIKGRNLYRLKTFRQPWPNEDDRVKVLEEKHSRGDVARSARMDRLTGKKRRRLIMKANTGCNGENVSESSRNRVLCKLTENGRNDLHSEQCNKMTSMFDVHVSSAGTIIGKRGKNIKAITRASGAIIHLRKDPSDSKIRIVEIIGSQEQIQQAINKLKQSLESKGFPPPVQR